MAGSEAQRAHPCRRLRRFGDFCPWRRSGNSRAPKRARPDLASEHATTLRSPWPGHVPDQLPTFVPHTPVGRSLTGIDGPGVLRCCAMAKAARVLAALKRDGWVETRPLAPTGCWSKASSNACGLIMTVLISVVRRCPGSPATMAIRLMSCGNCRVTGYERAAGRAVQGRGSRQLALPRARPCTSTAGGLQLARRPSGNPCQPSPSRSREIRKITILRPKPSPSTSGSRQPPEFTIGPGARRSALRTFSLPGGRFGQRQLGQRGVRSCAFQDVAD